MGLKQYLNIASRVSEKAGDYLLNNFGGIKRMYFDKHLHYVVKQDRQTNKIYEDFLKKETPEVALFTEEGERNLDAEFVWVVDPLEGTSNYRVGNPFFATQICLLRNLEPVVSVVVAPALKQKYKTTKGGGAYLNNKKISVSKIKKLDKALVSIGKGTRKKDLKWFVRTQGKLVSKVRTFRNFGACGLEMAMTAAGMIDVYMNSGSHLYDYAPSVLLVREAGGVVTNIVGKSWSANSDSLMAGNKSLVNDIVDNI